jgi:hypothetical protein
VRRDAGVGDHDVAAAELARGVVFRVGVRES